MRRGEACKTAMYEARDAAWNAYKRQANGRKHPATKADLRAAVEASDVKVTRIEPGAHLGWRPSWY